MMVFMVGFTIAQRTVTGTIVDSEGLTLIGANVTVPNTTIGTITDIDGNFSLSVPTDASKLEVSYTGFETSMIDLDGQTNYAIILREGSILDEIVVTAGGLEKNKARIGYAIQNVDADEIVGARETNIVNALNSKVAGVQVTSSAGSPGASSSIRIRGSVSVNKSNQPLFVVDGVPIDNSSGGIGNATDGVDQSNRAIDLNPNDIESMTVLKGASATALYGVRAANGAIVITTKKGTSGAPIVNISTSYGFDRANKFPERQSTYSQGAFSGGVATYRGPETGEGDTWGPLISSLEFDGTTAGTYAFDNNGSLTPIQFDANGNKIGNNLAAKSYDPYSFFKTGTTVDFNASVSGGTEGMRYYVSAGRLGQTGIVPNADFTRTSFRANVDGDITDRLSFSVGANYINSGGSRIQRGSNLQGVMLGLLRNTPTFDIGNGLEGQEAADSEASHVNEDGSQRSYRHGIYDNPYWTVNKNPANDDVNRIIGRAGLAYEINDWMTARYTLGVDQYSERYLSAEDINNLGRGGNDGSVIQAFAANRDLNSDLTLGFNKGLTDDISLSGLVGYNVFDTYYSQQLTEGTTLSAPGFYHISNASDLVAQEGIARKRIHGLYTTADIGYKSYAFLNLTYRNDWSSALPSESNTYASYSASLGLGITEMLNISNDYLDYAKLRLSYGVIGNDAPIYATTNVYDQAVADGDGFIPGVTFPAFGTNAFERSTQLANNTLTPEKATTYEVGAELKFFKGRLGADLTYYNTKSEDIILAVQLSGATGYTSAVQNSGSISNTGWELILNAVPVRTSGFEWGIDVNFTTSDNTVEELAPGVENVGLAGFTSTSADLVPGLPYSVLYGTGFQRTDAGEMIIGADGWPLADPTRKALGDPNPDWTAGMRNTFSYKNLSISGLMDIRVGGDMWCGTCGIMNYFGTSEISAAEREDVVVFEGVVVTGTDDDGNITSTAPNTVAVPLAHGPAASEGEFYRRRYGFGGIAEMNIHDTSWLRLRELSVKYNLSSSILGDGAIKGLSIGLTARNLWLSTDYPGIDPETNLTGASNGYGLDYFNMPNTKGYTATVNLTF